jgi:hypothetical protein
MSEITKLGHQVPSGLTQLYELLKPKRSDLDEDLKKKQKLLDSISAKISLPSETTILLSYLYITAVNSDQITYSTFQKTSFKQLLQYYSENSAKHVTLETTDRESYVRETQRIQKFGKTADIYRIYLKDNKTSITTNSEEIVLFLKTYILPIFDEILQSDRTNFTQPLV